MSENGSGNGRGVNGYMAAFGIGALVGAGLAVLYAPLSGEATRGLLAKRTRELGDKAGDVLEGAKDAVEETKGRVMGAVDAGIEAVRSEKNRAVGALSDAKEAFHAKKDAVSDAIEAGKEAMRKE